MENAINFLPNEVLAEIFKLFSFQFLSDQICIVSRRFAQVAHLIIFPAKNGTEKIMWKKASFSYKQFTIQGCRLPPPIPEIAPPPEWILGIKKFYFSSVDWPIQERMKNFIQYLADSNQIQDCKILLTFNTYLAVFDQNSNEGFFAPMRGKVVEFTVNEFQMDDGCFNSGDSDNCPFSRPFLREIPQLRLGLDNMCLLEEDRGVDDDRCQRLDVARWLGTPLPIDSAYKSRKLFITSGKMENVTGLVGLITLNYLHSSVPCPFDVFIEFEGDENLHDFLPFHPCIHTITGEALQIRPIKYGNNKEQFLIRRCPAAEIADEPMIWSTKNCVEFVFE